MVSPRVDRSEPTQEDVSEYIFSCFPDCLLKASPSKNLALFLQNHEIPADLHDQFDGWNSEAIGAAIKLYIQVGFLFIYFQLTLNLLQRCNIPEVLDTNLTMDKSDQMNRLVRFFCSLIYLN